MEANFEFAESRGMVGLMSDELVNHALQVLVPLRHVAWGGNMNNSQICAIGYGTAFTAPAMFHTMDHLGIAQYLTRLALSMSGPERLDEAKQAWMVDPTWQALRRYVEDTPVLQDPVELFVAQNLALDGLLYPLVYERYVDERVALGRRSRGQHHVARLGHGRHRVALHLTRRTLCRSLIFISWKAATKRRRSA